MDERNTSDTVTEDAQVQHDASESGTNQPQGSSSDVVQISRAELDSAIADAATSAASELSIQTLDAMGEIASAEGTVALSDSQWQTLTQMDATHLHTDVVTAGLIAILLGAVIAIGMTFHWRANRG